MSRALAALAALVLTSCSVDTSPFYDVVRVCTLGDGSQVEVCSDLDDEQLAASLDEQLCASDTICHGSILTPCLHACEGGSSNASDGQWCEATPAPVCD